MASAACHGRKQLRIWHCCFPEGRQGDAMRTVPLLWGVASISALIATALLGASLNSGEWVNAHREATEGKGEDATTLVIDFGFGPQGLHYRLQVGFRSTVILIPIEHINHTWTDVEDVFNPKGAPHLTGVALQSLLFDSRNTMIAGDLAAAVALFVVVACASTQLGKFVNVSDRVVFMLNLSAIGLLALASILGFASFGAVNASEVRSSFIEEWNKVPEHIDFETLVLSSGNASAMDAAAAGAVFAAFAAAALGYLAYASRGEAKSTESGHLMPARPGRADMCTRCAGVGSGVGILLLGGATFLSVASLAVGMWVRASLAASGDDHSVSINYGFGPLGAWSEATVNGKSEGGHVATADIEDKWLEVAVPLNPSGHSDVTGQSTERLLSDVMNMMIAGVVAGGAGAILAIPLVIQQLCGGLSGLPTGVRVSAVLAALLATACAALNAASFGLIYESSLRDSFISGWNHGSTKIGDETVSLVAGNTDAMNAAAGAAGFALLAAIVIVITSCCCGSSKSEDSVKSALLKS